MRKILHVIYVPLLIAITVTVFAILALYGADFYFLNLDERFFHEKNEWLKPSGFIGHGIGIIGSFFMVFGVFSYMARKRIKLFSRIGVLKYWLEFHIFLCSLGPVLILYHTSFKFGGIVSISFWSMIAVVLSGVLGRFIYIQIPRTIEGREMSLNELNGMKMNLYVELEKKFGIEHELIASLNNQLQEKSNLFQGYLIMRIYKRFRFEKKVINQFKSDLRSGGVSGRNLKKIVNLVKNELVLNRRIFWLSAMQNYLSYWHVAHLPFALIMLVIMIIHVIVAVVFGYKWIF